MRGPSNISLTNRILRFWLVSALAIAALFVGVAYADTAAPDAVVATEAAPKPVINPIKNKIVATLEPSIKVTVEGKSVPESTVSKNAKGALFVRAEPIFAALDDDYEFNAEDGALIVRRSQDGVVMELYTDTGIVKANGKAIGKLRVFGEVTADSITLTPNAIAVLAGTKPKQDKVTGELTFELDSRLRVASGYQLYVNDVPLGNVQPAAKSVGPVLLLPLLPIAQDLGHFVQVAPDNSSVTVRRAQDSATFELNLETGLVKQSGRPIGVSKDVTYFDQTNLLLPVSAIETLTGTHIKVEAGTDRVDINLDDRLKGAIAPGESVDETANEEPLTVEELSFHTGLDTINEAELSFRIKKLNGRVRYTIPELPTNAAELQPDWLSLQYRHLDGAYGSVGDYSADLRELDGVGIRRIKGASFAKESENGRWAAALGAPVSGTTKISDAQNRLEFSGLAGGVRYADKKGWEAGVSIKKDGLSDDQMAVLSAISGKLGRRTGKKLTWDAAADIGVFNGPSREKSSDVRLRGDVRYNVSKTVDVDVFANYSGSEFLRNDLTREALEEKLVETELNQQDEPDSQTVPDIRVSGQDQMSFGASVQVSPAKDIGFLSNPGFAVRVQQSQSGVSVGSESGSKVTNYGITGSSGIAKTGVNVTADYNSYTQSFEATPEKDQTGNGLNIRAYKNWDGFKLRAQYSNSQRNDDERKQRLSIAASTKAYNFKGPKESSLSVSPSVSANWTPQQSTIRGGIIANANSGEIFGPKTRAQASLGVLQGFGGDSTQETESFFTASIARRLKINDNMALSLSYRNDLKGDQQIGLQLDGLYSFNAPRKYKSTEDGAGVMKGRAFLDKNRDGVRQEDEPGIRGSIVRVRGSGRKLALRTDGEGYFTIQNIDEGIYEASIDNRSLPIGFALAEDANTRATISDGRITTVNLPVVQRGQIRGFAFIDKDGNGTYEKSDDRLEGARLRLTHVTDTDLEFEAVSTSFGQYAFDDLPAGEYQLEIVKTNADSATPSAPITVSLTPENGLMERVRIAAGFAGVSQLAETKPPPEEIPPDKTPAPPP